MRKIAFLDIDDTLIESHGECQYNLQLIQFLKTKQWDGIYLVSGRNPGDLMRFKGKNKAHWRNQCIPPLVEFFRSQGLQVNAVCLPFDLYLNKTRKPNDALFVQQAGEFYTQHYAEFEQLAASEIDGLGTSAFVGKRAYRTLAPLTEAMQLWLFEQLDSDKKGQFEFLMQKVVQDNPGVLPTQFEVFFWDDKPENLLSAQSAFKKFGVLPRHMHTERVTEIKSNNIPWKEDSPAPKRAQPEPVPEKNLHEERHKHYRKCIDALLPFCSKMDENEPTREGITQLHRLLISQHDRFLEGPQTHQRLKRFQYQSIGLIRKTRSALLRHHGFEFIHPLLRRLLGLLTLLTVVPALVIVWKKSYPEYKNLFFKSNRKEGFHRLLTIETHLKRQ